MLIALNTHHLFTTEDNYQTTTSEHELGSNELQNNQPKHVN